MKIIIKLFMIIALISYSLFAKYEVICFTPDKDSPLIDPSKKPNIKLYETKEMNKVMNDYDKKGWKLIQAFSRLIYIYLIFEK